MKLTTEISKRIDDIRTDPNDGRQSCFLHRLFESGLDLRAAIMATYIDGDVLDLWRRKDSFGDAIDAVRKLYEEELLQLANSVLRASISTIANMQPEEIQAIINTAEDRSLVDLLREISRQKLPAGPAGIIYGEVLA